MRWGIWLLILGLWGCQGKTEPAKTDGTKSEEVAGNDAVVPKPQEPLAKPWAAPTKEEIQAGWIKLFDGESLFGWEANDSGQADAVNWRAEDGIITADSGKQSLLLTWVPFADYEFRCEYRLAENGNSGVFLRTVPKPTDPAVDCYELNFCENHETHPTGSLVKRIAVQKPVLTENQWVTVHVIAKGTNIKADFNGVRVLDFTDTSENILQSGRIGLQKNVGKIEFRHVALRPLGTEPVFNGKDLTGWHEVPGSKGEFEVQGGTIHVKSGLGFLETDQTFKDFVLEAEAMTNGEGVNSGIFFRGLKGEEGQSINGYELQVQNALNPKDPTEFVGDRTGGIFRRVEPRKELTKDREWLSVTLVASGPRFATWVNGEPTVAFEDDRKPDPNPRKGLSLEAGHISLQGHDETTDVNFRDLKIAPLPKADQ